MVTAPILRDVDVRALRELVDHAHATQADPDAIRAEVTRLVDVMLGDPQAAGPVYHGGTAHCLDCPQTWAADDRLDDDPAGDWTSAHDLARRHARDTGHAVHARGPADTTYWPTRPALHIVPGGAA